MRALGVKANSKTLWAWGLNRPISYRVEVSIVYKEESTFIFAKKVIALSLEAPC